MPILDILKNVVTDAGAKLVKSVGDAFNDNFTSKEEKLAKMNELQQIINDNNQKIIELAQKADQMYLADLANARALQVAALSQNDNFSKRFIYFLTIGLCTLCFTYDFMLFFVEYPPANRDMLNMAFGVINSTTLVSIVGFFYGSSQGSADKGKQLETLLTDKTVKQ